MLLAIYLNDHLAGATVGRDLARRAATSNRGSTYGSFLERLAGEIDEDRDSLLAIIRSLDIRVDNVKVLAGWGAEKLGRLKPNGRLRSYSPLSRVVEIEMLSLGVHGKLALWRSLEQLAPDRPELSSFDLAALAARAESQLRELEAQRLQAAAEAFAEAS